MIGNWFGKERSLKMSGQLNCKDLFSEQVEMRSWEAPVSSLICACTQSPPRKRACWLRVGEHFLASASLISTSGGLTFTLFPPLWE